LEAGSPLKAEAAKIKAAYPDDAGRAAAALRLVQEKVRYLFLGMNDGGYVPAPADVTWKRLFGDCKGKTVLLLALLHELGIEAVPALVNATGGGDGMDLRLPMPADFDHVIVRATVDGKVYWLDGTRLGDRTLKDLRIPPFRWALPLKPKGSALEKLEMTPLDKPDTDTVIRIDASAGIDLPAPAHIEIVARGDEGYGAKIGWDNAQPDQRERNLKDFWKKHFDFITVTTTGFTYDEAKGEARWTMDGTAKMGWAPPAGGGARRYEADEVGLGWKEDYSRDPGPGQDAPFGVNFPYYTRTAEHIVLPNGGKGFTSIGKEVDQTLVGYAMKRTIGIDKGVFDVEASMRSLVQEVPAEEARAEQDTLKTLATGGVFVYAPLHYEPTAQESARSKRDADVKALILKGLEARVRHDLDGALAAFEEAAKLDPNSSAALANRGGILLLKGRNAAAEADLRAALKLNPREPGALMGLGQLQLLQGHGAQALELINQELAINPKFAANWMMRASVYLDEGKLKEAEPDIEKGLELDPKSAWGFELRARLRARQGRLADAAQDCDAALKLDPKLAGGLTLRGQILLDQNQPKPAIEAFDKALEQDPKDLTALTQRGRAWLALQDRTKALADVDNAVALAPDDLRAHSARAFVLFETGDKEGAIAEAARMIALRPKDPALYLARGRTLIGLGRNSEAIKDVDAAIALKPTSEAYLIRAAARPAADRKSALDDIDQAKALDLSSPAPLLELASLDARDKDYAGEIAALGEALKLKPDLEQARDMRAFALGLSGKYDEGLKDMDASVTAAPSAAEPLNSRCWYRATNGRELDAALKDCNAALKLKPGESAYLDSRGMVQLRLGRFSASISDYDAALKTRPTQAASLYGRGLARLKAGDPKGGAADLAAAKAASPEVEAEFAGYGLKP
jgi:tetratricopeptide (TPR) repeat protein